MSRLLPLIIIVISGILLNAPASAQSSLESLPPPTTRVTPDEEVVTDLGGPVSLPPPHEELSLLAIDTLLYVDNHGLNYVRFEVNGHQFSLTSDPAQVDEGSSLYHMPERGELTMKISSVIRPEEDNVMKIWVRGPESTFANIIVADVTVTPNIDYVLDINPVPTLVALHPNYPNPFNDGTTIRYTIPETDLDGLAVELVVYDLLGRRIKTLVTDKRYGGTYDAYWNGRTAEGSPAPPGIYIHKLRAGDAVRTGRMLHVR